MPTLAPALDIGRGIMSPSRWRSPWMCTRRSHGSGSRARWRGWRRFSSGRGSPIGRGQTPILPLKVPRCWRDVGSDFKTHATMREMRDSRCCSTKAVQSIIVLSTIELPRGFTIDDSTTTVFRMIPWGTLVGAMLAEHHRLRCLRFLRSLPYTFSMMSWS